MKTTYIIAVSGGVDSVVLLHKLVSVAPDNNRYIVAHVDHGIRPDSADDAEFVSLLAKKYGLLFETTRLELGSEASEATAREARYTFLYEVMKKHIADAIVTAHHQDDVLETMVVNILRGTSPRGLIGFSQTNILRPFIHKSKQELLTYAHEHKLSWREDATNQDDRYLRNYVRLHWMPKLAGNSKELLVIREKLVEQYREIDDLTKKLLVQTVHKQELVRSRFVILPYIVQQEVIAAWFRLHGVPFSRQLLTAAVIAIKTMPAGKQFELSNSQRLRSTKKTIILNVGERTL